MNLSLIERLTKDYADSRQSLAALVTDLDDQLTALKRKHLPAIKRAVTAAAAKHSCLHSAIDDYPQLFLKPRTHILHGIRVGIVKGKGKIEVPDTDRTLQLIEKRLPELLETLAPAQRTLAKAALKNLTVEQLKAIACSVTEAGDHILIQPVDDAVEKLITALLKDATSQTVPGVTQPQQQAA